LGNITQDDAVDQNGNQITDFASDTGVEPIFNYRGDLDITDSCFDLNRVSVIRRSIQTNLITSIANYNRLSQKGYEYVLPVFNEEDWYKLTTNISITSFLQGIPIGAKYFNDYCIITNNVNKEVVTLDTLYAITEDGEVHLINCKDILDNNKKVIKVYKNTDFEMQSVVISEDNARYYYPHYETRCYNCLVNVAERYDIDYLAGIVKEYDTKIDEYIQKASVNTNTLYHLRKEVLQAFARESYDLYKVNEYFKGYDETISTEYVTQEQTANLDANVVWNSETNRATVVIKKKAEVENTLKIQYLVNPTNQEISDNSKWRTADGDVAYVSNLVLNDKVYIRLFDGTYDGDYIIKIVKDTMAPEETKVQVVEGTLGNNEYYVSDVIKVKINAGKDNESGTDRLIYYLSGDTSVSEQTIIDGQIIEIVNNGITTITAKTIDKAGNSSVKLLQLKKDSLEPYEPTIQILGNEIIDTYYKGSVNSKFAYGQEREQPNASGIKCLHYEVQQTGTEYGNALDGQEILIDKKGTVNVRAYMEDNAGNKSAVVTKTLTAGIKEPEITATLSYSDVTTKSFKLKIGVKDEIVGIDKIVWYYKKSTDTSYKNITTMCSGEKNSIVKEVTIDNLLSGKYDVYAEVYNKVGLKTQTGKIIINTKNVGQPASSTASPAGWTNGNVTITLPTQSGFTTEYQIGSITGKWLTYNSTNKVVVSSNTTVYYRYNDGVNQGKYASKTIKNIDKSAPTITSSLSSSNVSGNSFKLNITVRDQESGIGKIVWYYKPTNSSRYTSTESFYTTINGTKTGETSKVSKTKTINGLTADEYHAYAVVYNVAGGSTKSSTITITLREICGYYTKERIYNCYECDDGTVWRCDNCGQPGLEGNAHYISEECYCGIEVTCGSECSHPWSLNCPKCGSSCTEYVEATYVWFPCLGGSQSDWYAPGWGGRVSDGTAYVSCDNCDFTHEDHLYPESPSYSHTISDELCGYYTRSEECDCDDGKIIEYRCTGCGRASSSYGGTHYKD